MPVGDAVGEVLGSVLRFVARIVFETVFELLIKGAGYVVIKVFRPRAEPGDAACAWVGLAFWTVVSCLIWLLYDQTAAA